MIQPLNKFFFTLWTGIILATPLWAQSLPTGIVHDKVVCVGDATQTYALYLPSTYTPSKRWPMVVCFDPGARGNIPVRLYQEAAETFGYIVAGSNTVQNYLPEVQAAGIQAMIRDTTSRWSVDPDRIIGTGFSGGSRLCTRIANQTDWFFGIIACGASDIPTMKKSPLAYYCIVGLEDMNYLECRNVVTQLEKKKALCSFDVFSGGHVWPPKESLFTALGWMTLAAMKTGRCPKNDAWVQTVGQHLMRTVTALTAQQLSLRALRSLRQTCTIMEGLQDTTSLRKQLQEYESDANVQKAAKKEASIEQDEVELRVRLIAKLESYLESSSPTMMPDERSAWQDEIDKLRRLRTHVQTETALMGKRTYNFLEFRCIEMGYVAYLSKDYLKAVRYAGLLTLFQPDNPTVWYNVACYTARSGDTKAGLNALKTSLEKGLKNPQQILKDPDLEGIRSLPGFKKIQESLEKQK